MDLKEILSRALPSEAVTQHPTKTYLSSIKAIYVTERFNEAFGVGKWTTKVVVENVNHDTGMVIVKVIFEVPELKIYYESFGGNDNGGVNNKNFDLGDAYKGASTDALTKIGSYLGVGIDVFKGKQGSSTRKNSDNLTPDGKEKSWLNKDQLSKVVEQAKSKGMTSKDLRSYYKISKEVFTELEKLL